jgi:hypothetical protein
MKGCPSHIEVMIFDTFAEVRVWVASPTGDSSDSHLFDIPCTNAEQARTIARQWASVWNIPQND